MPIGRFLAGVAALIWDPGAELSSGEYSSAARRYLLLRRSAQRDFGAGTWECVTGRVDQGESFTQALQREVYEEINCQAQIEFIVGATHFYRGEIQPENELLGLMYGCTLKDPQNLRLDAEHSEMLWASPDEINALLPAPHWLRRVIQRAEQLSRGLPDALRREFRQDGFEF